MIDVSKMTLSELRELHESSEFANLSIKDRLEVLGRLVDDQCQKLYNEGKLKPINEVYNPFDESEDSEQ